MQTTNNMYHLKLYRINLITVVLVANFSKLQTLSLARDMFAMLLEGIMK